MALLSTLRETLSLLPALVKTNKSLGLPGTHQSCLGLEVERRAHRLADNSAMVFEGRELTWGEFNRLANRYAHALRRQGVKKGRVVSVMMENRPEFLALIVGLNKLGAVAALLNTNLTGKPLAHCIDVAKSHKVVVGHECSHAVEPLCGASALEPGRDFLWLADLEGESAPDWAMDLTALASKAPVENPSSTEQNTFADPAFYIYTSGTTGLPKAAIMSNRRFMLGAQTSAIVGLKCHRFDRLYLCLPLYHATGLMLGFGAACISGASVFLRRRFSASNFLREVREHDVTCFIYIGELCRYLLHQREQSDDWNTSLTKALGNGLRPDVWMEFKKRFGISRVIEFYGASESNIAFMNVFNKDCTVGTTSMEVALVRYSVDDDEIIRNASGLCEAVSKGEPGLLLGKITEKTAFEGYTDAQATESKILRNVFKEGDAWFNTGDMLKTVPVGFALGKAHYQFVDRVGDTFRWKSENVSTNEVGELLNAHPQFAMCNVYGVEVPGADGRAGMAAVALHESETTLDISRFSQYVVDNLPRYAQPVFVRLLPKMDTTGTFKLVKTDLRKEAYDLSVVSDPVYVLKPGAKEYELLDRDFAEQIKRGEAGY